MRILFLTPQFPYPPHKGTTLRNYNLIAGLAPRHEIDLLSFADTPPASSPLDQFCRRIASAPILHRPNWRRALDTVLSPWPDMGLRLWSSAFRTEAHRFYGRLGFVASHEGFKLILEERE